METYLRGRDTHSTTVTANPFFSSRIICLVYKKIYFRKCIKKTFFKHGPNQPALTLIKILQLCIEVQYLKSEKNNFFIYF